MLGFLSQKGRPIITGLPQKLIDRLRAKGAASEHRPCPVHVSLTIIEPDALKSVALEMLLERGVDVSLYSMFAGVVMDGDQLRGILIESKAGR